MVDVKLFNTKFSHLRLVSSLLVPNVVSTQDISQCEHDMLQNLKDDDSIFVRIESSLWYILPCKG